MKNGWIKLLDSILEWILLCSTLGWIAWLCWLLFESLALAHKDWSSFEQEHQPWSRTTGLYIDGYKIYKCNQYRLPFGTFGRVGKGK